MTNNLFSNAVTFIRCTLLLAALLISNISLADSGAVIDYHIRALPMAEALKTYARQTNLQVAFTPQSVQGLQASAVQGQFTPAQALEMLLGDNDLDYQFASEILVVVRGPQDPELPDNVPEAARSAPAQQQLAQDQTAQPAGHGRDSGVKNRKRDEEPAPQVLEEVLVTGSHIRGTGPVGSQVLTYNREDIDIKGFSTLTQFIENLPQNFSGGITEATNNFGGAANGAMDNFNDGTGVNLRGLGNVSTLVLLNGQRLAPTGTNGSYVDISMIPLTAIERVEVLTDGASAIYGSDAIGGVVNFIMRKDYDGAETRLRYGQATDGGLEEVLVGQTVGKTWAKGYGLASYEYSHRDSLHASDRSFSKNANQPNDLLPEQKRHSLFLSGGYFLTPNTEISTTGYYSKRDSARYLFSPPYVPVTLSSTGNEQYGGSLGVDFNLGQILGHDWHAQAVGAYTRNESVSDDLNVETEHQNMLSRGSENLSFDISLDGSVFSMPGGDARLAVGGHARRDRFFNLPVSSKSGSVILPLSENFDRDVSAVFGELYLPLVSHMNRKPGVELLELSIAGRHEHYSDFGSTDDPKFGVKWSPVKGLYIRGTYGTSFRAPLFTEMYEGGNVAFLINSIPNPASGNSLVILMAGAGNKTIQPETATTWTAGFDLQPVALPALNVNVTYFSIDYTNRIATPPYTTFTTLLTDPRFSSLVSEPNAATYALIANYLQINLTPYPGYGPYGEYTDADAVFDGRLSNLASNKTTGLDFQVDYALETGHSGTWNLSLSGTYLFDYLLKVSDTAPSFDAVNTIQNPIDLRMNANVGWTYNGFSSNVLVQYTGDYINNVSTEIDTHIDSWTTVNLSLSYTTKGRASGWLDNMIFRVSAVNVLNQDPPFVQSLRTNSGINYDPGAANPMGRLLSFQVTKEW